MKKIIAQHKFLLTLLLFIFVSLASIYLTGLNGHIWTFLGMNNDGRFHVVRMEGLYESMRDGVYLPAVNMTFMDGFGYISNIFYSNLWLYPVALLRMAGLSIAESFVAYYVILNFCTLLISFWSFYQVSHRYDKSLVFSLIYSLSIYRIFDMVRRFDIGETLTFTFLPLVVLGVYAIFYGNRQKWIYLAIGMSAVIYSHALSPILIVIFILMVMVLRSKTLIREPRRLLSLLYASLTSLALTLAYFLPIYEQLKTTQFKLTHDPLLYISQGSMELSDLWHWSLTSDLYNQNIGALFLLVILIIPFTVWFVKNPPIRDFAIIAEILFFMTTNLFPWQLFVNTPLNMIQFPWRFFIIISILIAIILASDPLNWFKQTWKKVFLVGIAFGLTIGSEQMLIKSHPDEYQLYSQFNDLNKFSIGAGQEYLPKSAQLNALAATSHLPQLQSGTAEIFDFKQKGSKIQFKYKNAQKAKVDVPVISYHGYSAKNSTGKVSEIRMNQENNGLGQLTIDGAGQVEIDYFKTTIQRISRNCSIFSLFILILGVIFQKKLQNRVSLENNELV